MSPLPDSWKHTPSGRPRARGARIPFPGQPGTHNAITDVPGVEVGYCTLISGDGEHVIFNTFKNSYDNPNYLGHKSLVVQDFDSVAIGAGVFGFVNCPEMDSTMPNHKPLAMCINHPDYVVCNTRAPSTYVVNWRTTETWKVNRPCTDQFFLTFIPSAMWIGDLPSAEATTPELSLSTGVLQFDADGSQQVTVSNSGIGTLSAVTVAVAPQSATWLTTGVTGTGNEQVIANTVDATGLAGGVYEATVTVSGGGASNTVSYTVTLNVGTVLAAPTGLAAQVIDDTLLHVRLDWVDNTTTEAGFVIVRMGVDTQQVASLGPNVTTYLDEGVPLGTYTYRVTAVDGQGTTGSPADLKVVVDADPDVFVTSPVAGQVLTVGTVCPIQWFARKVTVVEIRYSVDGGESWIGITQEGGVGDGEPEWGNYPWTVPQLNSPSVIVRVLDYGTPEINGESGALTVSGAIGAANVSLARVPAGTSMLSAAAGNGEVRVSYGLRAGERALLEIFGLDGASLARMPLRPAEATGAVVWDAPRSGTYLLRLRAPDGVRSAAVSVAR